MLALLCLGGCGSSGKVDEGRPVADTSVGVESVVGKYRMEMTPEEVVELGGLEKAPLLFLNESGVYNVTVDEESVRGNYVFEAGRVRLKEDGDDFEQVFIVQDGGERLVEDTADDPLAWQKVVTTE